MIRKYAVLYDYDEEKYYCLNKATGAGYWSYDLEDAKYWNTVEEAENYIGERAEHFVGRTLEAKRYIDIT
jgi:hypothetical protein